MNDVFRADDAFDDEGVALSSAGDFLDDDVVTRVHEIAPIRVWLDNTGHPFGQREDGLRPAQAKSVAEQQLTNQRLGVILVRAFDALYGRRASVLWMRGKRNEVHMERDITKTARPLRSYPLPSQTYSNTCSGRADTDAQWPASGPHDATQEVGADGSEAEVGWIISDAGSRGPAR